MGGNIPEGVIAQVRDSHNIVDVISGYLALKKSGQNYTGLCPFHSEKTPSFVVSPGKQLFHCFGCGAGGDLFHFLMRQDHLSFPEAIRTLAQRAGISIPDVRGAQGSTDDRYEVLFSLNREAAAFFRDRLRSSAEGNQGRTYLQRRGITPATEETFQLGWASDRWDGLYRHLMAKGFQAVDMVKAGLVLARESGSGYYDRFRARLIFPIHDLQKRVVGFGGRILDGESTAEAKGGPKYLNSPETPVFQKGRILYGLDKSREGMRDSESVIVVEGYMDVLTAHQAGILNVVATMGTALSSDHLSLVKRFVPEIVLTYDADAAGEKAVARTWEIVQTSGLQGRVLHLPQGEDPDSFIQKNGKESFLERLQSAPDLVDYLLNERLSGSLPASVPKKAEIAEGCLTIIRKVTSPIQRDLYVKRVSERLGISTSLLMEQTRGRVRAQSRTATERGARQDPRPGSASSPSLKAEETLIALLMQYPSLRTKTRALVQPSDLLNEELASLLSLLLAPGSEEREVGAFLDPNRDLQGTGRVSGLFLIDIGCDDPEKGWRDAVAAVLRHRIDRQMAQVKQELSALDVAGPEAERIELLQTQQRLALKKQKLLESY